MKLRTLTFVLVSAALFPAHLPAQQPAPAAKRMMDKTHQVSGQRMEWIKSLLADAAASGQDLTNAATIASIEAKIAAQLPMKPAQPVKKNTLQELNELAAQKNAETFTPELDAKVKAEAERRAAEKFPLVLPRTQVTIQCTSGPLNGQTISGTFYSATSTYVQIGAKRIAFVDLTPEQSAMFDARYSKRQREKYTAELLANYESKKARAQQRIFRSLMEVQQNENEKNGYLYDSRLEDWITAGEYFKDALQLAQDAQKTAQAQQAASAADGGDGSAKPVQSTAVVSYGQSTYDTGSNKRYREIMDATAKKWEGIRSTLTGVDAAQGFGNACWGSSRMETAYIFSRNTDWLYTSKLGNDMLTVRDGTPAAVKFFYRDGKLCKTEELYGNISYEVFDALKIRLHEILGLADEEKAQTDKDLFAMIERGELSPKAENEGYFVFKWTGKHSTGELAFIYDVEADEYRDVSFMKELRTKE